MLSKIKALPAKETLVLLGKKNTNWSGYGFSEKEFAFLNRCIKNKETKTVHINQYERNVYVQLIEEKDNNDLVNEACRRAGNNLLVRLNDNKDSTVTIVDAASNPDAVLSYAEGMALGNYRFIKYRNDKKKTAPYLKKIKIYCNKISSEDLVLLNTVIDANLKARTLVNEPVSFLTAAQLSKEIQKLGKEAGFKVEVFGKSKIESLKMGGLLAVNKGSLDPPTFTIMEWKPQNAINKKPFVLVGKGVVFDTGGLSLKPTLKSMDAMKCDMSGAAAVASVLYSVAKSRLPLNIVGLVPATDNRPSGNAYAPGDVITMYDGTTVEVLNTDAEGRLILADALSYAKKYKPELVIDLATLTGSAAAAIGHYGIVSMHKGADNYHSKLKNSGDKVHERLAEMPFWEEYDDLIKSEIADLKNIGGPTAGAITAGKFLCHFTDYPWIHLDIAGPAFLVEKDGYRGIGGTGVGVRLLFRFFTDLCTSLKIKKGM